MKKIGWFLDNLKRFKYKPLLGLLIGLFVSIIIYNYLEIMWLSIVIFLLISLISMILIIIFYINKYTKLIIEFHKKENSINPDELRGISDNLDKFLDLDKELTIFLNKYASGKKNDYFEDEINKQWETKGNYFVETAKDILSKMNNKEIMLGLLGTNDIKQIINVFDYFKPYIPDIEYLEKHPEKAKEYYYKNLMQIDSIKKNSINEHYFRALMNKNFFEEIEKFILSQMNNKDIMELANSSKDWYEKIYYYGFLKKDNKEKK